jgi:hypothetical protein
VRGAPGDAKSFQCGARAERDLVLALSGVGQRLDPCSAAEFAHRHAKGAIDVFRRERTGPGYESRPGQKNAGLPRDIPLAILRLLVGH